MKTAIVYVLASLGEIAGCFSFWAWLRLGKSPFWLVPGMASLAVFAYLLTRIDSNTAGRAYAAYGSVYIVSSICWLWAVEGAQPDRWETLGAAVALETLEASFFGLTAFKQRGGKILQYHGWNDQQIRDRHNRV